MISLKRNDKLIIIVAVAVIIIAAIGIAAYNPPDKKDNETYMTDGNEYTITWMKQTGSSSISDFADKNSPYNESHTVTTPTGSVCVLTNVDFEINWKDDKTIGLIIERGRDTLTAEFAPMDGGSKTHESKGSGNETISFSINEWPNTDSIRAEDVNEAKQIIDEMYANKDTTSFDISVNVKTGEAIRRPLKYFSDNGNNFDIKITYEYFSASIDKEDKKENSSDGSNDSFNDLMEEEYTPPFLSMIISSGTGRLI